MRHGKKLNHLSRTSAHRKALLANLATSLIIHKRISTTVAKAKALKKYVEPLITKAKEDTTHHRRTVFSYLKHKDPIKELFGVVADKIADRPGGYTRILKTGNRLGDNAETCIIELVDFNDTYTKKDTKKGGKKRTRRGGAKTTETIEGTETIQPKAKAVKADKKVAPVVEEIAEAEVITDAEVISEPEIIAEAEVITEPEVIAEAEVVTEPEVAEVKEEVIETVEPVADETTSPEATETTETEEEIKEK
jgi:large subunit ribosomal protein L17